MARRYKPRGATEAALSNKDVQRRGKIEVEEINMPNTDRSMSIVQDSDELEMLKRRDALPPPAGYMYQPDGRLVPIVEVQLELEDPRARQIFCEMLEITGSMRAAADAIGHRSLGKVKSYINKYPQFAEEVEGACERHRDSLYAHAYQRATVGYEVPVIGGKDKNEVVAYERKYSDSLLALMLKRHFVEFRDTKSGNTTTVNVQNNTQNVTMPSYKDATREQRAAMRLLLKDTPKEIDATAIEVIDAEEEN